MLQNTLGPLGTFFCNLHLISRQIYLDYLKKIFYRVKLVMPKILPNLLSELSVIDIFIHDSRHSFSNQLYEYETSWPSIKNLGFLISDDISNDAFIKFSKNNDRKPILIKQNKKFPIGIIKK